MSVQQAEIIIARHARRNFWMNVLDGTMFVLGMSVLSRYTVLPLFVERLSPQPWLQGLIPMLFYVGWLLPGLFIAPVIASLPRRKPWIMIATTGERFPFLILGLVLLWWPTWPVWALLLTFFSMYAIFAFSAGFTSTAWQDFIGRVIPQRRWGIFFGLQNGLGGLLGVVGAAVATTILATQPFPQSVGILSLICFVGVMLSYMFLGLTIEPAQPAPPREPLHMFLRGIIPLLRRDTAFRRYLFSRTAIAIALVGHSFITAAALGRFRLPNEQIGVFTVVLLGAQAVANLGFGALADRWGHKQVLELSTALGLLAMLLAVIAPTPAWFMLIFVLIGASQAGYQISAFTLAFAFSGPQERPTYIGVSNTALAPAAIAGPLLAGGLASLLGYNILFVVLALIGVAGLGALHWHVILPVIQPELNEGKA
ncbi:MAG TPA: MFS transporter [Roseiflexaceae bacterium]|nr:MFS transporter [Roseiflexaceae bacterium]